MQHSVMLLSIWGVVADKVGFTKGDLIVKFMCPRVSKHGEVLVCKSTKNTNLILYFALNENNNILLVTHRFYELFEFSRILVLMSFIFEYKIPLALDQLREVLNFIMSKFLEHLREFILLLLRQYISFQEEIVLLSSSAACCLSVSINRL